MQAQLSQYTIQEDVMLYKFKGTTSEAEAGGLKLWVWGQSGLQSEF